MSNHFMKKFIKSAIDFFKLMIVLITLSVNGFLISTIFYGTPFGSFFIDKNRPFEIPAPSVLMITITLMYIAIFVITSILLFVCFFKRKEYLFTHLFLQL